MADLVRNPKDRFSHKEAHIFFFRKLTKLGVVGGAVYVTVSGGVWSQETNQVRSLIDKYRGPLVHVNDAEQVRSFGL